MQIVQVSFPVLVLYWRESARFIYMEIYLCHILSCHNIISVLFSNHIPGELLLIYFSCYLSGFINKT